MMDGIALRRPLHLKVAGVVGPLRSGIANEVEMLEHALNLDPILSKQIHGMATTLDAVNDELIDLWLEKNDPTCDPHADIRPVFDGIESCEAEWEAMKPVLAVMGVPEERMAEHKVTFTIAYWRGGERG